jgi:hypothetical protein
MCATAFTRVTYATLRVVRVLVLVVAIGCAPVIDGPVERQRATDLADADRLAVALAALPGAIAAHATLHRSIADPLTTAPPSPAGGSALIIVDDRADRAAITREARALAPPEITDIVIEIGAARADLATVGPFTVDARSKNLLRGVLGALLAAIAALAGYVAVSAARSARGERHP